MKLFVTSFSPIGYELYGRKFLQTFIEHWPKSVRLLCYYEGEKPTEVDDRIVYLDLLKNERHAAFMARHKDNPGRNGIFENEDGSKFTNYRYQAVRFAHKVYALTDFANQPVCDWLTWIDADVVTNKPMPEDFFEFLHQDYSLYYLGRKDWHHSECGFVAYNMQHKAAKDLLMSLRTLYDTDKLFELEEWHDSYLFDQIRNDPEFSDLACYNLSENIPGLHVWPHTILGEYMTHNKGPEAKGMPIKEDKKALNFDGCATRYDQITRIIAMFKPVSIVEVGTWNGDRAILMATEALKHKKEFIYYGFDLFEQANKESDDRELNVKKHFSADDVRKKLLEFKEKNAGFDFALVAGDTRETLHNYQFDDGIDLAFIDGGHSIDTIKSDYEALKSAKLVLFDDFYHGGADTTKFGCNILVETLEHTKLPIVDQFSNGLNVGMALVGKAIVQPGAKKQQQRLEIKTKNCVDNSVIQDNVRYAIGLDKDVKQAKVTALEKEIADLRKQSTVKFLPANFRPHLHRAVLVGGDATVRDESHPDHKALIDDIRAHYKKDDRIFAVKSSHDILLKNKIIPYGCFLLDPRPHVREFIEKPDHRVRYFVASMCVPEVWNHLLANNCDVYGYHASVDAGEQDIIKDTGHSMIFGGTTAGLRGLNVLYSLGFRKFDLYGFSSSYDVKPAKAHGKSEKDVVAVELDGRHFLSDCELVAQCKDIEMFMQMVPEVEINTHDKGMFAWAVERSKHKIKETSRGIVHTRMRPWMHYSQMADADSEAYWIDNAIAALRSRREELLPRIDAMPRLTSVIK